MFAGGCKGKGKGKGKGSPELGKGHALPKVRISAEKFTGTVTAWKGKYGWIQPAEEIEHEKAKLHNGGLFVSMDFLVGRTDLEVGATVEFHICEDESGLGAEEVVQRGRGTPNAGAAKGGPVGKGFKGPVTVKGKDSGKGAPKGAFGTSWGAGGKAAGVGGKAAGPASWGGKGWTAPAVTKTFDSGKWGGKGKFDGGAAFKGKGKGKDGTKGKGHTLPRTRISADKFLGTVITWKGKYGWIQPAEEIPHEKASKNKGGLFVSMDDIMGVSELTPGATVEFHIWEDSTGLGAEEVVQS